MKFHWEEIWNNQDFCKSNHYEETSRAKVIGGWLVTHITACDHINEKDNEDKAWTERRCTMVFVSDPTHEWSIDDEENKNETEYRKQLEGI